MLSVLLRQHLFVSDFYEHVAARSFASQSRWAERVRVRQACKFVSSSRPRPEPCLLGSPPVTLSLFIPDPTLRKRWERAAANCPDTQPADRVFTGRISAAVCQRAMSARRHAPQSRISARDRDGSAPSSLTTTPELDGWVPLKPCE